MNNNSIMINGLSYNRINGTLSDGRCFAASVYWIVSGDKSLNPNSDTLNAWIVQHIIKPINDINLITDPLNPNKEELRKWVLRYAAIPNTLLPNPDSLPGSDDPGLLDLQTDLELTEELIYDINTSTSRSLDWTHRITTLGTKYPIPGNDPVQIKNEIIKRIWDNPTFQSLVTSYMAYINSLATPNHDLYEWMEPEYGPAYVLSIQFNSPIIIYNAPNNHLSNLTPSIHGIPPICVYYNYGHYNPLDPSNTAQGTRNSSSSPSVEDSVSNEFPKFIPKSSSPSPQPVTPISSPSVKTAHLKQILDKKIMAIRGIGDPTSTDRQSVISLLYQAQRLLFPDGPSKFRNESQLSKNEKLAFDILFLNVMWWIVDGLGHDMIYQNNLTVNELWEQAKKILPEYKHIEAKNFLETCSSNDKTKSMIRGLMDPIMLDIGLAYQVRMISLDGLYKQKDSNNNDSEDFKEFKDYLHQVLSDNGNRPNDKMLQIRVDSAVSDFFRVYMNSYCTQRNDLLLNEMGQIIRQAKLHGYESIEVGERTVTVIEYLKENYGIFDVNSIYSEAIKRLQQRYPGINWCGASIDTTVQKDPLGMKTSTMVTNSGGGDFIQNYVAPANQSFSRFSMQQDNKDFDVIDENKADRIGINDLMFVPLVFIDTAGNYILAKSKTGRREQLSPDVPPGFNPEEVIYQEITFTSTDKKWSISYIFNSETAERAGVRSITEFMRYWFIDRKNTTGKYIQDPQNHNHSYDIEENPTSYKIVITDNSSGTKKILFVMVFDKELLARDPNLLIFATALLKTEGDYAQSLPSMQNNTYNLAQIRGENSAIVTTAIPSSEICFTNLSIDYLAAVKNILFSMVDLVCVTVTHGPATLITPITPNASDESKTKAKAIIDCLLQIVSELPKDSNGEDGITTLSNLVTSHSSSSSSMSTSARGTQRPQNSLITRIIDKALNTRWIIIESDIKNYLQTTCPCFIESIDKDLYSFLVNIVKAIIIQYKKIINDNVNENFRSRSKELYDPLSVIELLTNPQKIANSVPLLSTVYQDTDTYYNMLTGYDETFRQQLFIELKRLCDFFCNDEFKRIFNEARDPVNVISRENLIISLTNFSELWGKKFEYKDAIVESLLLLIPYLRSQIYDLCKNPPESDEEKEFISISQNALGSLDEFDDVVEDEVGDVSFFNLSQMTNESSRVSQGYTPSEMSNSDFEYETDSEDRMAEEEELETEKKIEFDKIVEELLNPNNKLLILDKNVCQFITDNIDNVDYLISALGRFFELGFISPEQIIKNLRIRPFKVLQTKTTAPIISSGISSETERPIAQTGPSQADLKRIAAHDNLRNTIEAKLTQPNPRFRNYNADILKLLTHVFIVDPKFEKMYRQDTNPNKPEFFTNLKAQDLEYFMKILELLTVGQEQIDAESSGKTENKEIKEFEKNLTKWTKQYDNILEKIVPKLREISRQVENPKTVKITKKMQNIMKSLDVESKELNAYAEKIGKGPIKKTAKEIISEIDKIKTELEQVSKQPPSLIKGNPKGKVSQSIVAKNVPLGKTKKVIPDNIKANIKATITKKNTPANSSVKKAVRPSKQKFASTPIQSIQAQRKPSEAPLKPNLERIDSIESNESIERIDSLKRKPDTDSSLNINIAKSPRSGNGNDSDSDNDSKINGGANLKYTIKKKYTRRSNNKIKKSLINTINTNKTKSNKKTYKKRQQNKKYTKRRLKKIVKKTKKRLNKGKRFSKHRKH
jgi:hypothetical protein